MVVTEILPSGTYRISQLESSNGRLYATPAHISQKPGMKTMMTSENSDDEPEMQRPKRTVHKP
ncbi:hypothetical protein AVEN_47006-1, partial [Araneus ventricosus]